MQHATVTFLLQIHFLVLFTHVRPATATESLRIKMARKPSDQLFHSLDVYCLPKSMNFVSTMQQHWTLECLGFIRIPHWILLICWNLEFSLVSESNLKIKIILNLRISLKERFLKPDPILVINKTLVKVTHYNITLRLVLLSFASIETACRLRRSGRKAVYFVFNSKYLYKLNIKGPHPKWCFFSITMHFHIKSTM